MFSSVKHVQPSAPPTAAGRHGAVTPLAPSDTPPAVVEPIAVVWRYDMVNLSQETAECYLFQIFNEMNIWELSSHIIKKGKWGSVVIADYPDYIQCEWLSDAARIFGIEYLIYFSHGGKEDINTEYGNLEPSSISSKIFDKCERCLVITNENIDFVLFKSDNNSYFIVSGPEKFMKIAYRASFDAAKIMFYDYFEDAREGSKNKHNNIWNTYAVPW